MKVLWEIIEEGKPPVLFDPFAVITIQRIDRRCHIGMSNGEVLELPWYALEAIQEMWIRSDAEDQSGIIEITIEEPSPEVDDADRVEGGPLDA
jgi:hypothetical protein